MLRLNKNRFKTVGYTQYDLKGDGVISDLKDKFIKKVLLDRPKVIDDLIKREGKFIVEKVEVCRKPIRSIFEKLLNVFTFGQLKEKMKEKDYDRLFHLYVILHLSNGTEYHIEKNERMAVKTPKLKSEETQCLTDDIKSRNINLETFITAPEKVNMDNLYRYSALNFNCQNYVKRLLNANGITKFDNFILQKVEDLAPSYLKILMNTITDIAGSYDFLKSGGSYSGSGIYEDILNGG